MIYFNSKDLKGSQLRAMNAQYNELWNMRDSAGGAVEQLIRHAGVMHGNAALTPAQAYLEFDRVSVIERNPFGEFALLDRVLGSSKSVSIGKEVYKRRAVSNMDQNGSTSMSGNQGVPVDHTGVNYQGTIIPIHDQGYGRKWREIEAMRADGYDALVDDARESGLALHRRLNDALWNGHKDKNGKLIVVDGVSWRGLTGDDAVVQRTAGVNIALPATTPQEILTELRAARDILMITNNLSAGIEIAISREALSRMEDPVVVDGVNYGSTLDYVRKFLSGITSVYADPMLTGGSYFMGHVGQEGLHSLTGMARGNYAIPRPMYNSDYNFIQAQATGFMAISTYSGFKCALYASL